MSADSLSSTDASKTFTVFSSDINLITAIPTGQSAPVGQPCRRIRVNAGSGVAVSIQYASGCTDTLPGYSAGDVIDAKAVAILSSGTTATSITVFW